jgi:hypothetical protein
MMRGYTRRDNGMTRGQSPELKSIGCGSGLDRTLKVMWRTSIARIVNVTTERDRQSSKQICSARITHNSPSANSHRFCSTINLLIWQACVHGWEMPIQVLIAPLEHMLSSSRVPRETCLPLRPFPLIFRHFTLSWHIVIPVRRHIHASRHSSQVFRCELIRGIR